MTSNEGNVTAQYVRSTGVSAAIKLPPQNDNIETKKILCPAKRLTAHGQNSAAMTPGT